MLKLVKFLFLMTTLSVSFFSSAGLITPKAAPLAQNTYVSYGGYDWTWASTYNVQFYFCDPKSDNSTNNYDNYLTSVYSSSGSACNTDISNQLMSADYHQGWSFFEDLFINTNINDYITGLATQNGILLQDFFKDGNGNKVQSFDYWNTSINTTSGFNSPFASDWRNKSRAAVSFFSDPSAFANTIYVRKSQPVPEPSTIFILAIGLLGLSARLRKS